MTGRVKRGNLSHSEENSRESTGLASSESVESAGRESMELAGKENMGLAGKENMGLAGIREIGTDIVGNRKGERCWPRPNRIPSLMDIHVSPPQKMPSLMDIHVNPPQKDLSNSGKIAAFAEVSNSQKSKSDRKKLCKETVQYDKSGMDFVESIQKQVLVLVESHKKKMESTEKGSKVKEDKIESKNDEEEVPSKRTRKDSKEDSNLFVCFYEGDSMIDEDDDGNEALDEYKDGETLNLPLPVPCLNDALKEPVTRSPLLNRRVVMEEAFGLGKCLSNMKKDPKILNNNQTSCVKANKSVHILPSPVPASRESLHVDVDYKKETPNLAQMITLPPPMKSQAKWRENTKISNPPTRAEIYRHTLGLDKKHPIATLHELCQKNKWTAPKFKEMEEIVDGGKKWRFSTLVNGKEFPCSKLFVRKKEAKVEAARICLQEMGIL